MLMLTAEIDLDRFKKDGNKYVEDVQSDVISGTEALKTFSKQPNAAETLKAHPDVARALAPASANGLADLTSRPDRDAVEQSVAPRAGPQAYVDPVE